MPAPARLLFPGAPLGIAGLHALGRSTHRRAGPAVPAQAHADRWAIHLLLGGAQDWELDGRAIASRGGDWLVVPPGVRYQARNALFRPCAVVWVQVGAAAWAAPQQALGRALAGLAGRYRAAPAAEGLAAELLAACAAPDAPLRPVAVRLALQRLLLQLARDAARPAEELPARVAAALAHLEGRLGEALDVAAAARAAGLRPGRLRQLFHRHVGMGPRAWLLQRRIAEAQRRLEAGAGDLTALALDLGFASAQHFADTFRRLSGRSASGWRAACRG